MYTKCTVLRDERWCDVSEFKACMHRKLIVGYGHICRNYKLSQDYESAKFQSDMKDLVLERDSKSGVDGF